MNIYHINYPEDEGVKYERFTYPAGEAQIRLLQTELHPALTSCARADELWVTARIRDGEIMNLALLIDAMRGARPTPVRLVLPYLPFSRADREFVPGDCCGLGVFGSQLNAMNLKEVVTVDAHNPANAGKFIDGFRNVSPLPLIEQALKELPRAMTLIVPDEGAAKRYGLERLGLPIRYCTKKRETKGGKFLGFSVPPMVDFLTNHCLIIDDICDGGGTFIGIAKEMEHYGVYLNLFTTHAMYSKGVEPLVAAGFNEIFTTNTYQPSYESKTVKVLKFESLALFGGSNAE